MSSHSPSHLTTAAALFGALLVACTALSAGPIATPAAGAAAGAAANPATTPPWEPDPNSVGGLIFYNVSGQVITGGSTTLHPLRPTSRARARSNPVTRRRRCSATCRCTARLLGSGAVNSSADRPLPEQRRAGALEDLELPVETGKAGDETLATLELDFPNTDTSSDGYADIYVLRLKTSAKGATGNTTYDSADIEVDITNSTWTVVYTQITATGDHHGAYGSPRRPHTMAQPSSWLRKLTPSGAAGSVEFLTALRF